MFICRDCNKLNAYERDWMFELEEAISYGSCSICKNRKIV